MESSGAEHLGFIDRMMLLVDSLLAEYEKPKTEPEQPLPPPLDPVA